MTRYRSATLGTCRRLLVVLMIFVACATPAASATPTHVQKQLVRVPRYSILEQALPWSSPVANPWEQVEADVHLISPSGKTIRIGGFYARPGIWKFRFAPSQLGRWSWRAQLTEGSHRGDFHGSFLVVRGHSPGFVRTSPYNALRWVFTDGAPFYPIGIQDCTGANDNPVFKFGLDGGLRANSGQPGRLVDMATYMRVYSSAGFNLFRWGPDNCSFPLADRIDPSGNVYSLRDGAAADQLFQTLRRYGFRIEMVLFGNDNPPFTSATDAADPTKIAAVERYVRYVVDRYGAYVDFWELLNETNASEAWLTQIGGYVHQIDPYQHPVGTSWSVPQSPVIQFGSDHWYQTEDPLQTDLVTWARLRSEPALALAKPTLVDEQGNSGQNWDPTSALRLRIRSWTTFFAESTLVFWNTSFAKDYQSPTANIYIGPEERSYVRVLQNYTENFDPRAKVVDANASPSNAVRGYALRGPRDYGLYLVAAGNRSTPTTGVTATVDPARAGSAVWIDPATGRILAKQKVRPGPQTLDVPPFMIDIALKISS